MTVWVYDNEESYDAWQIYLIKTDLPREVVELVMDSRYTGRLLGRIDQAEWFTDRLDSLATAGLLGFDIEDGRFGEWTLPLLREVREYQAGVVARSQERVPTSQHDARLFAEQNARMQDVLTKIDAAIERYVDQRMETGE